jgi:hypothetical protein
MLSDYEEEVYEPTYEEWQMIHEMFDPIDERTEDEYYPFEVYDDFDFEDYLPY